MSMTPEDLKKIVGEFNAGVPHKVVQGDQGMNLLEYFTAAAMTGILAKGEGQVTDVGKKAIEHAARTLALLRDITGNPIS